MLSSLLDNLGHSRFWTVFPGLQIRVWNLPDNYRSLPLFSSEDTTFWQSVNYFGLFELFKINVNIEHFLINSSIPLLIFDWWEVNRSGQMLQYQQHLFRTFCVITNSWWSKWTSKFCTNDITCHALWCYLSSLPYQFSIFEDVGGWQPWIR